MPKKVSLRIDDYPVSVPAGTSVLEAAENLGICIPRLCYLPELSPYGACRVCTVEIVRDGRSTLTASCTLEAEDGMIIYTHSPKVLQARKMIVELLLSSAPNSRAIQDLAVRVGLRKVRFPMEDRDCVLCGRCERVCAELLGKRAVGLVGRGKSRRVDMPFHQRPDACLLCGYCFYVCPMVVMPCFGRTTPGELCGRCVDPVIDPADNLCVSCTLGASFGCPRSPAAPKAD